MSTNENTAPAGTAPAGTAPAGTAPAGTAPAGTAPAGTAPAGTAPAGTAPAGTAPAGTAPAGTAPQYPKPVAIEVLEKNGVDVERLKDLILKGVGAEFTTYYYYTILRMHCTGLDGEGIKEIVEDARIEDRNHFEAMTPRLYELGGSLPRDIRQFADLAGCPDAYLPDNWQDINSILKVLLEAEQCAIRSWGEVCDMTAGKDPRTYDIAQNIMQEEIEHEAWFLELLYRRPSGHFARKFPGQSPHAGPQGSLIHL